MRRRQLEPSQSFTAGMAAKWNSSQLCRHTGDKDWDDQCCRPLLFSYRNSIPGSTGGHVAGASAAYENQALLCPIFNWCWVKCNYWWRQTYSALYYNNFSLKIFRRFQLALCSQVILLNQVTLTKIVRCPQYTTIDTIVYCHHIQSKITIANFKCFRDFSDYFRRYLQVRK